MAGLAGRGAPGAAPDAEQLPAAAQFYLLPVIGRLRIRDVEATDLDDVLARVGHLSANTQRLVKATARVLFTRALKDLRFDMPNPCDQVDSPRGALSPDDRTRVIRARCLSYAQLRARAPDREGHAHAA